MEIRPAQSLEYVRASVDAKDEDGVSVNPTTDTVALAFVIEGEPVLTGTTFLGASWETNDADPANPIYSARVLVGPSGTYVPAANTSVDVYVKLTDNPEAPIKKAGTIRFT